MRLVKDVDRRLFMKMGGAGSLLATLKPKLLAAQLRAPEALACPPNLTAMASDAQTYHYRDLFNAPTAMNEMGYAQAGKSVSAISAISFPPYACCGVPDTEWSPGYLLTCELFLDGRFLAIAAPPAGNVTYRWFPHCVARTQTAEQLRFTTRMFLPMKQRAVAQSFVVRNESASQRQFKLSFDMRDAAAKKTKQWFVDLPGEGDNKIVLDSERGCLIFEARHSAVVAVQGFRPRPDAVEQRRILVFHLQLGPGEERQLNFVAAIAGDGHAALQLYDSIEANFAQLEAENERSFTSLLHDAFTPGNSQFSGHLPRLVTGNETLWKLYHNGFANLLFARRVSPDSAYGPTYLTLSGHVLPTLSFPWDTSLTALSLALLDPEPLRNLVEVWLKLGMHDNHSSDYISGEGVGPWYAVNDTAIVRCAWSYLRVTGNFAWLDMRIGNSNILEHLEEHALYWKKLDKSGRGLGDYGAIQNLLEVVSTYLHEVAGMNANNVHSMRVIAQIHSMRGNTRRAGELRAEATALADRIVRRLYVEGSGYWRCGQPDGSFNEVRHCYDFLAVLESMAEDLSSGQKYEMGEFFWRELHSESWMRALSQADADATWNIRPDHSCLGAYGAWPAMSAKGLYKLDATPKLPLWLKEVAKAGNQGPIGQGHFVEAIFPTVNGGARKAPVDQPYTEDWSCIAGGAFADLVIDSIFGADLTLTDGVKVNTRIVDFDPAARLTGLRYQGSLYTVSKDGASKESP